MKSLTAVNHDRIFSSDNFEKNLTQALRGQILLQLDLFLSDSKSFIGQVL